MLTACESFQERFTAVPPKTHEVAAEPHEAYRVALLALKKLGFHYVRGGPAQGELEAINAIANDESIHQSRQVAVTVRFSGRDGGRTMVSALFRQIDENNPRNDVTGLVTEIPLRESNFYEALFAELDRQLAPK